MGLLPQLINYWLTTPQRKQEFESTNLLNKIREIQLNEAIRKKEFEERPASLPFPEIKNIPGIPVPQEDIYDIPSGQRTEPTQEMRISNLPIPGYTMGDIKNRGIDLTDIYKLLSPQTDKYASSPGGIFSTTTGKIASTFPEKKQHPIIVPGYGLVDYSGDTPKVILPEKPGYSIQQDENGEFIYLPRSPQQQTNQPTAISPQTSNFIGGLADLLTPLKYRREGDIQPTVETPIPTITPQVTTQPSGVVKSGIKGKMMDKRITWPTAEEAKKAGKLAGIPVGHQVTATPTLGGYTYSYVTVPESEKPSITPQKIDRSFKDYNIARLKAPSDPIRLQMVQTLKQMGIDVPMTLPEMNKQQFTEFITTGIMPKGTGLGETYKTPEDVKKAYKDGKITKQEAEKTLKSQWPGQFE